MSQVSGFPAKETGPESMALSRQGVRAAQCAGPHSARWGEQLLLLYLDPLLPILAFMNTILPAWDTLASPPSHGPQHLHNSPFPGGFP